MPVNTHRDVWDNFFRELKWEPTVLCFRIKSLNYVLTWTYWEALEDPVTFTEP